MATLVKEDGPSIGAHSLALKGVVSDGPLQALDQPQHPTEEYLTRFQEVLLSASWHADGAAATAQVLPAAVCNHIIKKVTAIVKKEPTLLELSPSTSQLRVTVVGDTHGHFQDVCNLLQTFGRPSTDRMYIFNGDFVDRGAWGLETLMLLLAYKWLLPQNVYLLRGNHEASWCTKVYGFKEELICKYGTEGKGLYKDFVGLFAQLPLAAVVESSTLILHGGLFRTPPKTKQPVRNLGMLPADVELQTGSLEDLRRSGKGGVDPDPDRYMTQLIASDVVWSDPSRLPGQHPNVQRGVGTRFGPDVTEAFLRSNRLKLIIRSHEGPDARHKRPPNDRMPSIDNGFCVDHETPSGKLVTLFSAPDYPMFSAPGDERYRNKAAVVHLSVPDYATPEVHTFEAVLPRPQAVAYYTPMSFSSDSEPSEDESSHDAEHAAGPTPSSSTGGRGTSTGCEGTATSREAAAGTSSGAPVGEQSGKHCVAGPAGARTAAPVATMSRSVVSTAVPAHETRSSKRLRS